MTRSIILIVGLLLSGTVAAQEKFEAPKSFVVATEDYKVPSFTLISEGKLVEQIVKSHEQNRWVNKSVEIDLNAVVPADAAPTPMIEVHRILSTLKIKPGETVVDWGCGDARFLIEAATNYGCKGIGIEIDLHRAATAQRLVDEAGLGDKITIYHADATKVSVTADVGVAYLYEETLQKLLPQIRKLKRFASYIHEVPGLSMVQNGDSYFWKKESAPVRTVTRPPAQTYRSPVAVWGGRQYNGPVCNNPRCRMCNSIRSQLR